MIIVMTCRYSSGELSIGGIGPALLSIKMSAAAKMASEVIMLVLSILLSFLNAMMPVVRMHNDSNCITSYPWDNGILS
jgi:hypothetical protein